MAVGVIALAAGFESPTMSRIVHYRPLVTGGKAPRLPRMPLDLDTCAEYLVQPQDFGNPSGPGSVIEIAILHAAGRDIWVKRTVEHVVEWDPSGQSEEGYQDIYTEIDSETARREVLAAGFEIPSPRIRDPAGPPPVIASQAAILRHFKRSPNTTGGLGVLKAEGYIERFEAPASRGGKYKVWFADPDEHQRALERFRPSRRNS